jgi:hypothetical protein
MTKKDYNSMVNKVVELQKTLLLWIGSLYLWFFYTYNTLDRSEDAYRYTGGTGPMISGYSIAILGVLLSLLISKPVFSKNKSISNVVAKVAVILVFVVGLYWQIDYDPSLEKLRAYQATKSEFTGAELLAEVNNYRKNIGVSELTVDEVLCSDLVERWLAIRDPNYGHKGFEEWWADKKLATDSYNHIGELYATADSARRVIELWNQSPGHKLCLDDPRNNVGCTYAAKGTGILIIAERE